LSCLDTMIKLGLNSNNIRMFDSKGLICSKRSDIDKRKARFAVVSEQISLKEAMEGADVFLGLSQGNIVSVEMIQAMAVNPIVFALANPEPEIAYDLAMKARPDVIMATGRSDHPNQVNNVLGFPFIFRGALDVRATKINDEMKLAAVRALADLARESVPEEVMEAYHLKNLTFGKDYIIPKPLDPRLLVVVSSAVAKAAMESGVAKTPISDWDSYANDLLGRIGRDNVLTRGIAERARKDRKRVVFAEGDNPKILKAAEIAKDEGVAIPILLGKEDRIRQLISDFDLDLEDVEIIDPRMQKHEVDREKYGELFYQRRLRKGINQTEAVRMMRERNYFGAMMVETGSADAMISGMTRNYAKVIRPGLQCIGPAKDVKTVCGMYIVQSPNGPLFFADTTVNVNPTAEQLVEITLLVAEAVQKMKISPRIAMISYSNFGSAEGEDANKVAKAVSILHDKHPHLIVDGDIQTNFALNPEMRKEIFPFSKLSDARVNTLIFPNLSAGNSSYKLLQAVSGMEVIGPILLGMKRSYHILQMGCSVREIVNMVRVAVIDAQTKGSLKR